MRPVYLEIHFFNGCCRCIHLCAVLSALSAQQDTSVSCAQVSLFVALKNRDTDGAISPIVTPKKQQNPCRQELCLIENLWRNVTHSFSSRYGTSRLEQDKKHGCITHFSYSRSRTIFWQV